MSDVPLVPVILSGGSGTRLWPVSRADAPKQLLPMVDERTMLLATLERVAGVAGRSPAIVVCNAAHLDAVVRDLGDAGEAAGMILMEPVARNTAPAVAAAARLVEDDPVLLVMPADHVVADEDAFVEAVTQGIGAAAAGDLVTFGIVPTAPATGYGYIHAEGTGAVRRVDAFVEKPDAPTAEHFVASGTYLWNSGMFMFRASHFLAEAARYAPGVVEAATQAVKARTEVAPGRYLLDEAAFAEAPAISIDYAVMEHTERAVVVPLDAGWSDVGSWDSLHEAIPSDALGNTLVGDVIARNVANSYLRSDGPLVAAIGVDDLVVVAIEDAVLVAHVDHSEDVKIIVEELRRRGRSEVARSAGMLTSWGHRQILTRSGDTSVERINLRKGRSVPLFPGTWVILSGEGTAGEATVRAGDTVVVAPGEEITLANLGSAELAAVVVETERT
jgi:mannose-1-phosphate guanylyltransferase/mannose-6-phosphate isomerase